jgi:pimeloyl-ACP methyl ester carboxylesterase
LDDAGACDTVEIGRRCVVERLTRDGVALAYTEAGSGAPPLLLVHGWCGDHTHLAPQFEHFGRNYRVVAVDLRGHGVSDKPEQEYTVARFADDLAWLCDQLRLARPVVVGHSMGGNVAFELARRHPDLPAGVVALDSAIVRPDWLAPEARQHAARLRGADYQEVQRRYAEEFFLPTDDAHLKARLIDNLSSLPLHVTLSAWEQHLLFWDGEEAAAACRVPALLISSATPLSDISRFQELTPQLVTGQTVGAGHFIPLLVPEQVNAMIERFLAVSRSAAA